MRRLTLLLFVTLLLVGVASAQWQFTGLIPNPGNPADTLYELGTGMHGMAVAPDGKIWTLSYYAYTRDSLLIPDVLVRNKANTQDSAIIARYVSVRAIHVYNPDLTPAAISPIMVLQGQTGPADTIGGWRVKASATGPFAGQLVWSTSASGNTGRGLRRGEDNFIYATVFGQVYKINPATYKYELKIVPDSVNSGVAVGVDASGNIFWNIVAAAGTSLKIYDNTGAYLGDVATNSLTGFSRATLATADGNDVFFASYTDHRILRYHSDAGVFGTYAVADTILKGFDCESMMWRSKGGTRYLWASAGSYNDMPNRYPGTPTSYTPGAWYQYNVATKVISDSLIWKFAKAANAGERPRGIDFSVGGDTAYVCTFGDGTVPGVRVYRKVVTAVEKVDNVIPSGFELQQNFPNPFNPSTEIRFSVGKTSNVALVLYDMLGREIAVLMYETLAPGSYRYNLNATGLASGTYVYELRAGDVQIAKKMTLLK